MLGITIHRPLPQKGNRADCSRLGKHVTRATCEDGHATAAGGASRRKQRSRHKRTPRRCSRNFPSQRRTERPTTSSQCLRPSRTRLNCRRASRPKPQPPQVSRNRCGAIAIAAVDVVGAAVARPLRSRQPFRDRVVQLARPLKPKFRRSPPNLSHHPHSLPSSRRAR